MRLSLAAVLTLAVYVSALPQMVDVIGKAPGSGSETFTNTTTTLPGSGSTPTPEAPKPKAEEHWCYGTKINSGSLRKFNYRMRGLETNGLCDELRNDVQEDLHECLSSRGCAPSGGGINCGHDAYGYVHGGVNVGLGCSGDSMKTCIDFALGMGENNGFYACNHD